MTLLHKGGEREDIKNWRPLTLLNCDYKIISKLLAERLKNVLTKLIHPDQKGFVKGRNISEANRMIQDIIQYADEENEEGIIVFLDQQKAFDRVEWGWVDFVLKTFNFGEKFRGWIQMLVKNATTSIKTNGFVSKCFSISRSCRQVCPVAPLIYILQAEPMACAIRGNNDIKGIKLPGEPGGKELEAKIRCLQMTHNFSMKMKALLRNPSIYFQNMKKHPDQELIIIKQKQFLLAMPAIENQNLIKYHGLKKM